MKKEILQTFIYTGLKHQLITNYTIKTAIFINCYELSCSEIKNEMIWLILSWQTIKIGKKGSEIYKRTHLLEQIDTKLHCIY